MENSPILDYQVMAENTKSDIQYRENLCLEVFVEAADILKCIVESIGVFENLHTVYSLLSFLRNSCIKCHSNQLKISTTTVLEYHTKLMEICLLPENQSKCIDRDLFSKVKMVSIQFLGNFVVQNDKTKRLVWQYGFPSFFFTVMSNLNEKLKDLFCMIIYNCLKERTTLFDTDEEYWLLISVLEHCQQFQHAEWGLLVLELIITSTDFKKFFQKLNDYPKLRGCLLDLFDSNLENNAINIPEENISYLAEYFMTKLTCILQLAVNVTDELVEESCVLLKTLSILGTATSFVDRCQLCRRNEKLFKAAIDVLKDINSSELSTYFSQPCDPTLVESELHPAFGFKRDLIKLIGNMIYKNKEFQNKIREYNAIDLLLNACNVDDKNPFILQWSIFAIRNLCDGNAANRSHIKQLEQQGVVTNSFVTQCNVTATLQNGKLVVSNT